MGARGPVPDRDENLARPRSRKGTEHQDATRGTAFPVVVPEADPDWHPIARMLWDSLGKSGQSQFYQQSDWAFAYSLCEDVSVYKSPMVARDGTEYIKRSGQMLQTIYSAMSNLLVTEADRRRVSIQLAAPEVAENDEAEAVVTEYKAALYAVPDLPKEA